MTAEENNTDQNNTPIKVYFKEIPCLRATSKVLNNKELIVEKSFYNLFLPHVCEEFRNETNNVAINCFPPFFDELCKKTLVDYIQSKIQNNDTRIYFDNAYEGHVFSCLPGIYKLIKLANLNPKQCYFITAAMNAEKLHEAYCNENNISNKINIKVLNSWERHIQHTSPRREIENHEYVIEVKEKLFLCFNRIFRMHRMALLGLLYKENLVKDSYYSYFPNFTYGGFVEHDINLLKNFLVSRLPKSADIISQEYQKHYSEFPLLLNNPDAKPTNYISEDDLKYYKNSYFSLVTETFFFNETNPGFDECSVFFSEKIFKPIICKHPFILVGRPKSLYYLKKLGYKTFEPFINESYDLIENDEQRLLAIVEEVSRLSKKPDKEWLKFLADVKDIVMYNFENLINKKLKDFEFIDKD